MTLTPELAKSIVEKLPGAKPIFATRGDRKGQHVKYTFRFEFVGRSTRHIAITRRATNEGVTVYVNQLSIRDIPFSGSAFKFVRVSEKYPKGYKGSTGDKGLSSSAGQLTSLNPENNDVLRLSVSSHEGFEQLLAWYLDLSSSSSVTLNEPQNQDSANSLIDPKNVAASASSIPQSEQDNLGAEIRSLSTDEREAVVKVRYGQGSFRDALIGISGAKCWMTGLEGKELLIASHIKPWSHCDSDTVSRGHPDNGLLLSALWDSAFDAGLISFDRNWSVLMSTKLSESARQILDIKNHFELPTQFRSVRRAEFITYHRSNIFQG